MADVLTLIADPGKLPLADAHLDRARCALDGAGIEAGAPDWLSPGEACDIPLEGDAMQARQALDQAFADLPLDRAVLPRERRRKRLLLADMDSTVILQECIDELADEIGVGARVAAITERAMRGEIAFEPALRERVALLSGVPVATAEKVLRERVRPRAGGRALTATMRANGGRTVLVSGGFTLFAEAVARDLGFDEHHANTLLAQDGAFTGHVAEPILGRDAKEATLRRLLRDLGLEAADAMAVGDGANDLGMLRAARLGVAMHAKPAVKAEAAAVIDHGDLTALLFLQGYRRDEFVE